MTTRLARVPSRHKPMAPAGFTLMEMLVVVAIIMILLSMLMPGLGKARMGARRTTCQDNMHSLIVAYQNYARENQRLFAGSNTGGAYDWIKGGNTVSALQTGKLWPYVQDLNFFQCPDQVYPSYLNSFSLNGRLNGEQRTAGSVGSSLNWSKRSWTSNMNDARQLVIMEEDDNRGWNVNSFMLGNTQGRFVDLVPANHDGGDDIAFLDGHVEAWKWRDPDMVIRPKHKPVPTFNFNDPGNVDWDRLNEVFMTWPK